MVYDYYHTKGDVNEASSSNQSYSSAYLSSSSASSIQHASFEKQNGALDNVEPLFPDMQRDMQRNPLEKGIPDPLIQNHWVPGSMPEMKIAHVHTSTNDVLDNKTSTRCNFNLSNLATLRTGPTMIDAESTMIDKEQYIPDYEFRKSPLSQSTLHQNIDRYDPTTRTHTKSHHRKDNYHHCNDKQTKSVEGNNFCDIPMFPSISFVEKQKIHGTQISNKSSRSRQQHDATPPPPPFPPPSRTNSFHSQSMKSHSTSDRKQLRPHSFEQSQQNIVTQNAQSFPIKSSPISSVLVCNDDYSAISSLASPSHDMKKYRMTHEHDGFKFSNNNSQRFSANTEGTSAYRDNAHAYQSDSSLSLSHNRKQGKAGKNVDLVASTQRSKALDQIILEMEELYEMRSNATNTAEEQFWDAQIKGLQQCIYQICEDTAASAAKHGIGQDLGMLTKGIRAVVTNRNEKKLVEKSLLLSQAPSQPKPLMSHQSYIENEGSKENKVHIEGSMKQLRQNASYDSAKSSHISEAQKSEIGNQSEIMVKVRAPSDLTGGDSFIAEMNGISIVASVPPGGIRKGQIFRTPMREISSNHSLSLDSRPDIVSAASDIKSKTKRKAKSGQSRSSSRKAPLIDLQSLSFCGGSYGTLESNSLANISSQSSHESKSRHVNYLKPKYDKIGDESYGMCKKVKVRAPADLPEGYSFKAAFGNEAILAVVPKGGVRKGDVFSVNLLDEYADMQ